MGTFPEGVPANSAEQVLNAWKKQQAKNKQEQQKQGGQSEEDQENNRQAMESTKNLPAGTYKWNGSKWVKQ